MLSFAWRSETKFRATDLLTCVAGVVKPKGLEVEEVKPPDLPQMR